jgi:hypothetical protein
MERTSDVRRCRRGHGRRRRTIVVLRRLIAEQSREHKKRRSQPERAHQEEEAVLNKRSKVLEVERLNMPELSDDQKGPKKIDRDACGQCDGSEMF